MAFLNLTKRKFIDRVSFLYKGAAGRSGLKLREKFMNLDDLTEFHFRNFSDQTHPCRKTLSIALAELRQCPAVIVETGSSAWGTNSSLLFDAYVNSFGGSFESVDIRAEPMFSLSRICTPKSTFYCDDSIAFLQKFVAKNKRVDLVYLDSWDVDWSNPIASLMHGLHEFLIILPLLRESRALLLIDDTPESEAIMKLVQPTQAHHFRKCFMRYGLPPGKGALVKHYLVSNSIGRQLAHDYQLLWKFD